MYFSVLFSNSFESFLKGRNKVLNILDKYILMFESVIHFLFYIVAVLSELAASTHLKVLYPLIFTFDLSGDAVVEFGLPSEAFVFLDLKLLLDLGGLLVQSVEYLSLLLDTGVPLGVDAGLDGAEVVADGIELVLEGLNAVFALLPDQVLEVLHAVVAADSLRLHVLGLLLDALIQLVRQLLQHPQVVVLELFQLVIHLLTLVYRVLLVVLYLPLFIHSLLGMLAY